MRKTFFHLGLRYVVDVPDFGVSWNDVLDSGLSFTEADFWAHYRRMLDLEGYVRGAKAG